MDIQANWLANFKAIIAAEISAAGNKDADGYRTVAARTGLGYDYIYQIYKDKPAHKPKRPSADAMNTIHRVYGKGRPSSWIGEPVDKVNELFGQRLEVRNISSAAIGANRIPLIDYVQAGLWTEVIDGFSPGDADEWLLTDMALSGSAFALEIKGDSMLPEFKPGDRVIIDPEVEPYAGDYVVAKNGHEEATFKKYRARGTDADGNAIFELIPLNPDFATIRSDEETIKIIGTMVEHRKYRRSR